MKKLFLLLLFAALFLAGCIHDKPGVGEKKEFVDCKKDVNCLKSEAEKSCGPAKVVAERFGVRIYAEATPKDGGGDCNLFVQLQDITLPEGASEEDRRTLAALRPLFPLASMDCELKKSEARFLEDPKFLSKEELLERCAGLLKEQIVEKRRLFVLPAPTTRATTTPASTPSPTAASNATPTPTTPATPAASASPTPVSATPIPFPPNFVNRTEEHNAFSVGPAEVGDTVKALAYDPVTYTLFVGSRHGIDGFRLNGSTAGLLGGSLRPPRLWEAVLANYSVTDLIFHNGHLYSAMVIENGSRINDFPAFLVVQRFDSQTLSLSQPLQTLPMNYSQTHFKLYAQANSLVVDLRQEILKYEISNPAAGLTLAGRAANTMVGTTRGVAIKDGHVLLAWTNNTASVTVFSPSMQPLYTLENHRFSHNGLYASSVDDVAVYGNEGYAAVSKRDNTPGVFVLDASNPANLTVGNFYNFSWRAASGEHAKLYTTPNSLYVWGRETAWLLGIAERTALSQGRTYYPETAVANYGLVYGGDLIIDENNPNYYGGVMAVGSHTGTVMQIGLVKTRRTYIGQYSELP